MTAAEKYLKLLNENKSKDFYFYRLSGSYYLGNPTLSKKIQKRTGSVLLNYLEPIPACFVPNGILNMQCWTTKEKVNLYF